MRSAAQLAGVSTSTIAHIETGRMNAPKGEKLSRLLTVYGGIKEKSFQQRVREFREKTTPRSELHTLIDRATEEQIRLLLQMAKGLMG